MFSLAQSTFEQVTLKIFWHFLVFKLGKNSKVLLTKKYFRRARVAYNTKHNLKQNLNASEKEFDSFCLNCGD